VSIDPVVRLAALHSTDAKEAVELRLPKDEIGEGTDPSDLLEDAVCGLVERIEEAICLGQQEISISVEMGELLAITLKARKRAPNRPRQTKNERLRRGALVAYAKQLKTEHRNAGMRAGDAEQKAAEAVASHGAKLGDVASAETIRKLMRSRSKNPC
jgi:hypothetical protein